MAVFFTAALACDANPQPISRSHAQDPLHAYACTSSTLPLLAFWGIATAFKGSFVILKRFFISFSYSWTSFTGFLFSMAIACPVFVNTYRCSCLFVFVFSINRYLWSSLLYCYWVLEVWTCFRVFILSYNYSQLINIYCFAVVNRKIEDQIIVQIEPIALLLVLLCSSTKLNSYYNFRYSRPGTQRCRCQKTWSLLLFLPR